MSLVGVVAIRALCQWARRGKERAYRYTGHGNVGNQTWFRSRKVSDDAELRLGEGQAASDYSALILSVLRSGELNLTKVGAVDEFPWVSPRKLTLGLRALSESKRPCDQRKQGKESRRVIQA